MSRNAVHISTFCYDSGKAYLLPFVAGVKSYTTKDQLRQHILAHAGKYQYVCDFCGQGFLAPKLLKYDHLSVKITWKIFQFL